MVKNVNKLLHRPKSQFKKHNIMKKQQVLNDFNLSVKVYFNCIRRTILCNAAVETILSLSNKSNQWGAHDSLTKYATISISIKIHR
jgi:hypothetical protein